MAGSARVRKFPQPSPSAAKSANRPGWNWERTSKNYDARVRRRRLSEPMTNLLSPRRERRWEREEGAGKGSHAAEGRNRWDRDGGAGARASRMETEFSTIPRFSARLELCHAEINCFTRPRNIVTYLANIRIARLRRKKEYGAVERARIFVS